METQAISVHPATWQTDLIICAEESLGLTVEQALVQITLIPRQLRVHQ